jgi:hypothetical protein
VQWDLAGVPSTGAIELLPLIDGLQTLWWATADTWNERTAGLRRDYDEGHYAGATDTDKGWSLWGKAYYGQYNSDAGDQALNVLGNQLTYNTNYRQQYSGFQAGADRMVRDASDGAWVVGALAGFNKSNLNYKADTDSLDYTVWNLGLYGSFLSHGPVFADLLIKDDIATIDTGFTTIPATTISANSIGISGTLGARFVGTRATVEPMLNLGYAHTKVDNLVDGGTSIQFDSSDSFRGRASVRLSSDFNDNGTTIQPFLVAGVGEEFSGENMISLISSPGANTGEYLTFENRPLRTFGLGSIGFNFFSDGPWSGFGKVDGLYSSHADGFALRLGIRYALGQLPPSPPPPPM